VQGSGFRVQGSGCRVQGSRCQVTELPHSFSCMWCSLPRVRVQPGY
jgi:hypothetical protein